MRHLRIQTKNKAGGMHVGKGIVASLLAACFVNCADESKHAGVDEGAMHKKPLASPQASPTSSPTHPPGSPINQAHEPQASPFPSQGRQIPQKTDYEAISTAGTDGYGYSDVDRPYPNSCRPGECTTSSPYPDSTSQGSTSVFVVPGTAAQAEEARGRCNERGGLLPSASELNLVNMLLGNGMPAKVWISTGQVFYPSRGQASPVLEDAGIVCVTHGAMSDNILY